MPEGENSSELESIAERALEFQRYIFRRAWGIYYAVWAAAIAAYSLSYPLILALGLSNSLPWPFYVIFYGGISAVAGFASFRIFGNANRAAQLRRILKPPVERMQWRYTLAVIWWLAFYVLIGAAFFFFGNYALTILYASLISVAAFVYNQLQFSFSNKIPVEGKLAVVSYLASDLVSLAASIFFFNTVLIALVWSITIVVWLFCALYSLTRAPEELAALAY